MGATEDEALRRPVSVADHDVLAGDGLSVGTANDVFEGRRRDCRLCSGGESPQNEVLEVLRGCLVESGWDPK
jgi:hypothetical protein